MSAATCTAAETPSGVTEPTMTIVPVNAVISLTVCHQRGSRSPDRHLAPGQPSFKTLVAVLTRPNDMTALLNRACNAYADGLIQVLARTPTGVFWLEVPHDMCGHYLRRPIDPYSAAFG